MLSSLLPNHFVNCSNVKPTICPDVAVGNTLLTSNGGADDVITLDSKTKDVSDETTQSNYESSKYNSFFLEFQYSTTQSMLKNNERLLLSAWFILLLVMVVAFSTICLLVVLRKRFFKKSSQGIGHFYLSVQSSQVGINMRQKVGRFAQKNSSRSVKLKDDSDTEKLVTSSQTNSFENIAEKPQKYRSDERSSKNHDEIEINHGKSDYEKRNETTQFFLTLKAKE